VDKKLLLMKSIEFFLNSIVMEEERMDEKEITFEDLGNDLGQKGFTKDEAIDFMVHINKEKLVDIGALEYRGGEYHENF